MNLTTLYDRLTGKETIFLDPPGLGDDGQSLFSILAESSGSAITLTALKGPTWEDESHLQFTLAGTAQEPIWGIPEASVTLQATANGSDIQFQLQIEATLLWSFETGFPKLAGTDLGRASLRNPSFILSTFDSPAERITRGINIRGELQLANTGILAALNEFAGGEVASLPVVGTLNKQDAYQLLILKARIVGEEASFNILHLLDFRFLAPELALYAYIYDKDVPIAFFKRIESDVLVHGKSGNPLTLPLALQLPTFVSGWQLMLQPERHVVLSDLLGFLALVGSAGQFNLQELLAGPLERVKNVFETLLLQDFTIEITGSLNSAPEFHSFSLGIRQQDKTAWTIIPDVLVLSDLYLYLRVSKDASGYRTRGFIRGDLPIGNKLVVNATIPVPIGDQDWQFSSVQSIALHDINVFSKLTDGISVTSFLPESLVQALSSLTLNKLDLIYTPGTGIKQVIVAVNMQAPWILGKQDLELRSLDLLLTLEKGVKGWGLSGTIQATLLAGNIAIDAQVLKTTAGSDWYFSLHANRVPLPSLSDLSSLAGGENAIEDVLPASLLTAQLFINNPKLDFNISKKKLEAVGFAITTDEIDFKSLKIRQASVDVSIRFGEKKNVVIYGKFFVADIDFGVYGHFTGEGGWQFSGRVAGENPIKIGTLVSQLASHFGIPGEVPIAIRNLTAYDIFISFNTKTKDFKFDVVTEFPVETQKETQEDAQELTAVLNINITHNDGKYHREFSGVITVGDLEFDLVFDQDEKQARFLAAFENKAGKDTSVETLVKLVSDNAELQQAAKGLHFNIQNALLVVDKDKTTRILFGLEIGGGLDVTNLPLVGKMLPEKASVRMNFRPVLASAGFPKADIDKIRPLVPAGGLQLPQDVKKGFGFNIQLALGGQPTDLTLPIETDGAEEQPATTVATTAASETAEAAAPPAASDGIKWFVVQKQLGPLSLGRVGVQYHDKRLFFLLDASLSLAGLTLSLDGLYVSSKLNPIQPVFGLHGLGLDYKKGPLEIGAAFFRQTLKDEDGNAYDTYDGMAIIRTKQFSLAAMGSYAYYQGHPSLFIYAFVNLPLGGPPFFFVTGLAAGFGYNRRLLMPTLDGVRKFPLVEQVVSGPPDKAQGLTGVLNQLHEVIPPAVGEYFFAVGVRFSSFKIIDSFLLLAVSFGTEFEVDVLGLSTLVLPAPEAGAVMEPLAEVQLALQATFNPSRGYLKVQAALTTASFLLSRNCHLTGGFAFFTWFKDNADGAKAGDFVLTLGGYHPRFTPPKHYPKVEPLGFNWQVVPELTIKGGFYFALVPSAVMVGGYLSATWISGNLKAWFNIGADFIISWKPYFYDAELHVDMGVSYTYKAFGTHHITVELGANLHLWGPEFSGKAHVHLWIVTFDVRFGARTKQAPQPLSWKEFRESFLPERSKWKTVAVTGGLVKQLGTEEAPVFVVNPKEFRMETGSVIPITEASVVPEPVGVLLNIGSMRIAHGKVVSRHTLSITLKEMGMEKDVTSDFAFEPVLKHVPGALWGPNFTHSEQEPEDQRLVKNACMGFVVTGKKPIPSESTHQVASENLLNERMKFNNGAAMDYDDSQAPGGVWLKTAGAREAVRQQLERQSGVRSALLQALQLRGDYHPDRELADAFVLSRSL